MTTRRDDPTGSKADASATAPGEAEKGWAWQPPRSWITAYVRALVVFAYFAIATVWLPSFLIGATSDEGMRDIVVTVSWAVAFGAGLWGLSELQRRRWL